MVVDREEMVNIHQQGEGEGQQTAEHKNQVSATRVSQSSSVKQPERAYVLLDTIFEEGTIVISVCSGQPTNNNNIGDVYLRSGAIQPHSETAVKHFDGQPEPT